MGEATRSKVAESQWTAKWLIKKSLKISFSQTVFKWIDISRSYILEMYDKHQKCFYYGP